MPPTSHLPANMLTFARILRRLGIPVGPGQLLDAVQALEAVGVERRSDVFWALHAVFVRRPEHTELFGRAFHRFWRDPELPENPMNLLPPDRIGLADPNPLPGSRRLRDVWTSSAAGARPPPAPPGADEEAHVAAYSDREVLKRKDFEQMSEKEIAEAVEVIRRMDLRARPIRTRRWALHPRGTRVDPRATLRATLRVGGDGSALARRVRRTRPPTLVALCDISGSMEAYSRMLLHFLHVLTTQRDRVHSFLFATRLTNVTRMLAHRDVDDALGRVSSGVEDWASGTRIGTALRDFNRQWSRRVTSQGAIVLLITDGLDRGEGDLLEREAARLARSCRELIWLNPLLRFDGFQARAAGVRALLPRADRFLAVHNLQSLEELAVVLSGG